MRIVVTGSSGQLGTTFLDMSKKYNHVWQFFDRDQLDITDQEDVKVVLDLCRPDVLINTAAYTAVDKAETDKAQCRKVNTDGVANLATYCKANNVFLVHYSTDYVYHLDVNRPLEETDTLEPKGVYAQSKVDGELFMQENSCPGLIMRTSWVYSEYGNNFVKTMLRLATEHKALRVVDDQIGAPTYTRDIVRATMKILEVKLKEQALGTTIVNFSNQGQISWYEFAKEIFAQRKLDVSVSPIPSSEYPTPAQRPKWSVLNLDKITCHGVEPRPWKESLEACLSKL